MNHALAARPLLCAAVFQAALMLSPNASALDCIRQTPLTLATQYQQADYVGQLKVLAHGTEAKNDRWFGRDLLKMQVELLGADVRGVRSTVGRKPETNTQWAWLNAGTAVGTVQDAMIASYADFDAGKFYGGNVCISNLFAAGTLDSLLPPKGSGGAVVLSATDYTEISLRFGLSAGYFPAYVLVNADAPQAKSIVLQPVKDGRRGDVQASGVPPGRYRLEPAFYPAGFSRTTFATDKGPLTTALQLVDRGAASVRGGIYPNQTLNVEPIVKNEAHAGQTAAAPAWLLPKVNYQFEYLGGETPLTVPAVKFTVPTGSTFVLLAGAYHVTTQLAGVRYAYGKDGIWHVKATDKHAAVNTPMRGFPKVSALSFVNLKLDFKTADGQAASPAAMPSAWVQVDKQGVFQTEKPQNATLYFKALEGVEYTFHTGRGNEPLQWRATADDALTIILK